ncbi:MAG: lipid A-modifier LpxR family protein [Pseudomonadota bacterium]
MGSRAGKVLLVVLGLMASFNAAPAVAQMSETIGTGRLFSNDFLGDGRDRWQSGSYVISKLRSAEQWTGDPKNFGEVWEYRFRTSVISSDGRDGTPDRRYAGTLSFGMHSHFGQGTTRAALGFDITAVGPQTGLSRFQKRAHDVFGLEQIRFTDTEFEDDILFGMTAETAEIIEISPTLSARAFGEVLIGPEDIVRVGADVFWGAQMVDDILLRDVTTGQLYHGTETQSDPGLSVVVGADMATVADSFFLPDTGVGAATQSRARVRAGLHWRKSDRTSLFYGLTYLSPEFEDQDEGQLTGSLKLNFNF